jgi:hypothetical protein|eukprot:COSAG02_NODE_3100_length_7376_cov_112.354267_4_plen_125_part_00
MQNEADADARDKINKHTEGFGRILIALHHKEDGRYGGWGAGEGRVKNEGVEVRGYFENWVKSTLSKTHSVCIWHFKPGTAGAPAYGSFYLAAVLKTQGKAQCLSYLGCERDTLHPTIPSDCIAE